MSDLKTVLQRGMDADECGWTLAQHDLSKLTLNGEAVRLSPMTILSALKQTSDHPWYSYVARWSPSHADQVLKAYKHYKELNDEER
jgi:hypothetical protein